MINVYYCPICSGQSAPLKDSEVIRECEGCGAEWEGDTGEITLNPNEL